MGNCAEPSTPKILYGATILDATRLASPLIVCAPVKYVSAARVWSVVVGVIVAAAFVVTLAVSDTDAFPAVPLETYPGVTSGVTDTLFVRVMVFVPVLTVADVPLIELGAVALPVATLFVACVA